jgi:pimeloyl-ACP methyl ester carboxylesterase
MSPLAVDARGTGRPILLIHGSATDRSAFAIQLGSLARGFRVMSYDRRGVTSAPLAPGQRLTPADHAGDAAAVLAGWAAEPAMVIGSSFGAIVALELALGNPAAVASLVLCEPPLPPGLIGPPAPIGIGCVLDAVAAGASAAAAEAFLGAVLGEAAVARMHPFARTRALAAWTQIRAESAALAGWGRERSSLASIGVPTLLVGGERSPPRFGDALDALGLVLPRAVRVTLAGAGHAMQIDQPRAFDRAVRAHAAVVWP